MSENNQDQKKDTHSGVEWKAHLKRCRKPFAYAFAVASIFFLVWLIVVIILARCR